MAWKFFVENKPWSGVLSLRIGRRDINGIDLVQPFVFKKYPKYAAIPDDEIAISGTEWAEDGDVRDFLQAAMDAAWEIGLRPVAAKDHTNELKAVRDHLADMRTLAFASPSVHGQTAPESVRETEGK